MSESDAADAKTVGEITLSVAGAEEYEQVLQSQHGKVVLVDFWATWCPPCMKQFPHTVELAHRHRNAGLAVISVSGDDGNDESAKAATLAFLQAQGAAFDNLISRYGVGQEHFDKFDITTGALPFYKLYDRQGKLRYQFTSVPNVEGFNVEPVEKIDHRVAELLAESVE